MSECLTFRGFVTEQLAAAVEDISALYERTIAACGEELCRSREENQRKQRLLDKALSPRVLLHRVDTGPSLNQARTPRIKEEPEEQSVTREQEQLPVSVSEPSDVCVKAGETSQPHQRQPELKEEPHEEDLSSEPNFLSETEGDTEHSSDNDDDEDWQPPVRCPGAHKKTEAHGDKQVQIRDNSIKLSTQSKSAPGTSAKGKTSGANQEAEEKKHQCTVCNKRFRRKHLQNHVKVHTGEKPYCCSICEKMFTQKCTLNTHRRTHTGEKPYCCSICEKTFTHKCTLNAHRRTHTGEKPYCCSICEKTFTQKCTLNAHRRTHTGGKPYCCSICEKTFTKKCYLNTHRRTHTGEKPYCCSICKKTFTQKCTLNAHRRTHTGEKPYCCSICEKTFGHKRNVKRHMSALHNLK